MSFLADSGCRDKALLVLGLNYGGFGLRPMKIPRNSALNQIGPSYIVLRISLLHNKCQVRYALFSQTVAWRAGTLYSWLDDDSASD